jgi:hypothetical protein
LYDCFIITCCSSRINTYRYDQIWDWEKATKSGKVEFVNNRVTPNKKVEAHEMLYQRGFVIPGFYQDVCAIPTTNGSNWTEDDKKRFKTSIFKELKNIRRVSTAIGKPMKECMTYYYGTFKKSKDYPRLKLAIYRHKQKASSGSSGDTWICDTCGDGGKLIACDSCELHYHLTCLIPPLQEVPEGTWICNRCSIETNNCASEFDSKRNCSSDRVNNSEADSSTALAGVSDDPRDKQMLGDTDQENKSLIIMKDEAGAAVGDSNGRATNKSELAREMAWNDVPCTTGENIGCMMSINTMNTSITLNTAENNDYD